MLVHAGAPPTVVSSSADQSLQEQCLLAKLAAANPSAFKCAAVSMYCDVSSVCRPQMSSAVLQYRGITELFDPLQH